jgi:hypothetical protein
MSKDIIIQKNGVEQELDGVTKITTPVYGGFSCVWVPEDERQLTEKIITQNGDYSAADDEVYAYSRVTASVEFPFTGTTPGGINYTVYLDYQNRPHLVVHGSDGNE